MPKKKQSEPPKSKYQEIMDTHGDLGEFIVGEFRALIKAGLTAFDAIKNLEVRISKLEDEGSPITIQLTLGNGSNITYTCAPADLDKVDAAISKWMKDMMVIYEKFLAEHVRVTQKSEQGETEHQHDDPEGYG